jgi:hypothetical protein
LFSVYENNMIIRNAQGSDIEPEYEPTITHIPTNDPVAGHPR